ncbi:F1F0 ATP synthase subunit e, mitochondrial [Penicillium ochrochloron]
MASTQGVNVFRYSALVAGLIYGVYHQSSLTQAAKRTEIEHEYARKERLIEQAKAEWKKKTQPKQETTQSSGLITDFEDPKFDLEAFLLAKAKENP